MNCCGQNSNDEQEQRFDDQVERLWELRGPRTSREIPRDPPQRLAVITTRFNPLNWLRPEQNYERFTEGMRAASVDLFTLRIEFNAAEWNTADPWQSQANLAEHLLWQKEAGINEAVRRLECLYPDQYDAIAWIDADLEFQNPHWVEDTLAALTRFRIVQLFDHVHRLGPLGESQLRYPGSAYTHTRELRSQLHINPGGAWACRTEDFIRMGGLFPWNFFGGGDSTCYNVWVGSSLQSVPLQCGQEYLAKAWRVSAHNTIRRLFGHISGDVNHLYHGSSVNRQYSSRWQDPTVREISIADDIEINPQGLLQWKPGVSENKKQAVTRYFRTREEDD